jgi:hypothetical protein
LSEASLRAKEERSRPREVGIPLLVRRRRSTGGQRTHITAVGGAGSSAAPAFDKGIRVR